MIGVQLGFLSRLVRTRGTRINCCCFNAHAAVIHVLVSAVKPQALKGLQGVIGMSATHPTWQKTRPDDDNDR